MAKENKPFVRKKSIVDKQRLWFFPCSVKFGYMELQGFIIIIKIIIFAAMPKINYELLPIKAHYFFFLAAMGPILPFLPVFGKHLGVPEVVVGGINGAIPLLFLALKPFFGYLIDYFQEKRKCIFMMTVFLMGVFFFLMGFIPDGKEIRTSSVLPSDIHICSGNVQQMSSSVVDCGNWTENILNQGKEFCTLKELPSSMANPCQVMYTERKSDFYGGFSFWAFVILMSLGTIGYNISNSMSDAICFDVLGEGNEMNYGKQRVWGTIGFGLAALAGGYFMSNVDHGGLSTIKDFFPAIYLLGLCVLIDLACCQKLKLPPLPKSESIVKDIWGLIREPHIATFLCFAVLVGICDASIIFYLLWYLEDLAKESVEEVNIKLLQGLTVAGETLVGEVVSFYLSGRILSKLGYGYCLSMCFFFYTLRLGLIALIPSPWWVLPVELLMQGPTYALCYTTIVAYASAVAPPGTSATVQGIVAGMDDGFGFAVGNIICSIIYKYYGGKIMFASIAGLAFFCSLLHTLLYMLFFRHKVQNKKKGPLDEITREDIEEGATVPLR